NGRSAVLGGDYREILRCIRCGACLNVCPVFRQASGHAYRSVYSGPVGAVLSPLLAADGDGFAALADLPRASSLCGACNEVCPLPPPSRALPWPRAAGGRRGPPPPAAAPPLRAGAGAAARPWAWRRALATGGLAGKLPGPLRPRPLRVWGASHALPPWRGGA